MQYANHYSYSDVNPFEVVRTVSAKTLEVRAMDAERDATWQPQFHVGGFAANCSNQDKQRWNITSNKSNPVVRIRLQKDGTWKAASGNKFYLADKPVKFYDYNF